MSTVTLTSTPSAPTLITREISGMCFRLTPYGLHIAESVAGSEGPLFFSIETALAMREFLRSPGVATLIQRAWLAEQHAEALAADGADVDEA